MARAVRSRFFTMDLAQRRGGEWIIVEVGDVRVGGLARAADIRAFSLSLVQNNPNTQTAGALYETLPPTQARSILDRLEFHPTPMTLDIYSHVLTDMQRDAVDALDTLPADGGSRAEEPPDIVE